MCLSSLPKYPIIFILFWVCLNLYNKSYRYQSDSFSYYFLCFCSMNMFTHEYFRNMDEYVTYFYVFAQICMNIAETCMNIAETCMNIHLSTLFVDTGSGMRCTRKMKPIQTQSLLFFLKPFIFLKFPVENDLLIRRMSCVRILP